MIKTNNEKERLKNYRAGLLPAMIQNMFKKKTAKAVTPLSYFETPKRRKQSTEEQIAICEAICIAFDGKDLRKNKNDNGK